MSRPAQPDVEIAAAMTARRLRFRRPPSVQVHADQIESARKRLSGPVHAGRIYRHVRAAMRAAGQIAVRREV